MKSPSKKKRIIAILERLGKNNPDAKTELFFLTDFQLLVSVVLSAQTTDKMVNRCMEPVYRQGFTPDTVLKWGEEKLLATIRTIGLAPTKAKNVYKLSRILKEKYDGQVPSTREELEALPGVGRKTANVVLAELYNQPTLAVDTHVFRVTHRLGFHDEKTPEKAEKALLAAIPEKYLPAAHHWLILHGRYTCKAVKPLCEVCCVNDLCPVAFKVAGSKDPQVLAKGSIPKRATRKKAAEAASR